MNMKFHPAFTSSYEASYFERGLSTTADQHVPAA